MPARGRRQMLSGGLPPFYWLLPSLVALRRCHPAGATFTSPSHGVHVAVTGLRGVNTLQAMSIDGIDHHWTVDDVQAAVIVPAAEGMAGTAVSTIAAATPGVTPAVSETPVADSESLLHATLALMACCLRTDPSHRPALSLVQSSLLELLMRARAAASTTASTVSALRIRTGGAVSGVPVEGYGRIEYDSVPIGRDVAPQAVSPATVDSANGTGRGDSSRCNAAAAAESAVLSFLDVEL